jgi:RHS repeat-associated protein
LISATNGSTTATYQYDGLGRRIAKTVNGVTTNYLSDGDQVIAEYNQAGTLTKKYVNGNGIDEVLTMEDLIAGKKYYYSYDGLGSVVGVTDNTANQIENYKYGVFGAVFITDANSQPLTTSAIGNTRLFTGRELDNETGLYNYRTRQYSPDLGRFLQTDKIGYSDSTNLYLMTGNNPTSYTDPLGMAKIKIHYNRLGNIGGKNYYHTYLTITDNNGAQYYFRGGPSKGGPSGGSSGQLSSGLGGLTSGSSKSKCSNSSNSTSPGAGPGGNDQTGPWGSIQTVSGPYLPRTVDYNPGNLNSVVVDDALPAAYYMDRLEAFGQKINDSNIPYNPFGNNSNTVAYQAIGALGLSHPAPVGWTPGSQDNLLEVSK